LLGHLENQRSALASNPVHLAGQRLGQFLFGQRTSPFTGEGIYRGLDICNRKEAPVIAPADGVMMSVNGMTAMGKA
jgi:murein DD-endopeptidase MepM/ murein hydrolase activator NlpD